MLGATSYPNTISASSNKLTQTQDALGTYTIQHDSAGNITSDGLNTYSYTDRGRLAAAGTTGGTVTYAYNALEQRVGKAGSSGIIPTGAAYYVYDEAGKLLGEYDASGNPIYETIYLGGPVGVIKQSGSAGSSTLAVNLYNVHTDQIATPRVITRQTDEAIVWRWDTAEAFGATAPDQNPAGLGTFAFNQRMPGQVFDGESGLLQNWNREYNPRIGRYMQSDPIGLAGGINTFAYVEADPLSSIDPLGLDGGAAIGGWIGGLGGGAVGGATAGPPGAVAGRLIGSSLGKVVGTAVEKCECLGGYTRLYRVVGSAEYASIRAIKQYSTAFGGYEDKQFWTLMSDAMWFAETEPRIFPSAAKDVRHIVASQVCNDTLRMAYEFPDVGHKALSFDSIGLTQVNKDAQTTGGIATLKQISPK